MNHVGAPGSNIFAPSRFGPTLWHRSLRTWMRTTTSLLLLALTLGCHANDGLDRRAVSGEITLDGEPLATGAILFEPVSPGSGTLVGATIRQSRFSIARVEGPVPGTYRVRIYSSSGVQPPLTKGQTERTPRPMVERIPRVYNTDSALRAEVSPNGSNRYRFELSSHNSITTTH